MTIFDHLWQSTLVAAVVCLLTLLFRRQSASIRYGLWLAASLKFLLPFSLLVLLGRMAFIHTVPAGSFAGLTRMRPFILPFSTVATVPAPNHFPWLAVLAAAWALGAAVIAAAWLLRWHRMSAIARNARTLPFDLPVPVRATQALMEPGLVGIWRPVILLPESLFRQLSPSEIDAILRHELCHLRRRDNLMAAMHMLVEALFWFHPLVWFIGARLVEEREAACDESVLAAGQNPLEYAQAILRVCRIYLRSPLACASGVAGADLGRRVDAIMARRALEDTDAGRKLLLAGLLLITLLVPLAAGSLRFAPPAQLVQRLATALLPAPATQPATIARPLAVKPAVHPRSQATPEPLLHVQPRTLEAALPAAPSLIVIDAPKLDLDQTPAAEAMICRPPQRLADSRLLGPQVCLPQSEWKKMKSENLVLLPDGRTLAASYESQHAKSGRACALTSSGSMGTSVGTLVMNCY